MDEVREGTRPQARATALEQPRMSRQRGMRVPEWSNPGGNASVEGKIPQSSCCKHPLALHQPEEEEEEATRHSAQPQSLQC